MSDHRSYMRASMNTSSATPEFTIRHADWNLDRERLRQVRSRVFIEEQSVAEHLEWDGEDERAAQLLAVDADGRPIGTARILPSGQIGRMAVLPEWRGRGVGKALLREALAIMAEHDRPKPYLNAQSSALPFYARMGFVAVGDEFMEAGIPHRKMVIEAALGNSQPAPSGHVLGQDAGIIELSSREAIRQTCLQLAVQTRRVLRLFSQDLEAELYDNEAFLEAVRQIALRGHEVPVRVLLADAEPAVHGGHRLIEIARTLTSKVQIRKVPEEFNRQKEAYLLADDLGYLQRRLADVYEAKADFKAPGTVRRLSEQFDNAWALGEIHQELRRLYL